MDDAGAGSSAGVGCKLSATAAMRDARPSFAATRGR
jgi:hypothetical protein